MPGQNVHIAALLRELGLERYAQTFRDAEVTPEVLAELTDRDLRELGLPLGPRKAVLKAIRGLAGPSPSSARAARGEAEPGERSTPSEAERRQLTVMFVDLVGSTALSRQLDPEDMQVLLGAYQDAVAGEVRQFEGHVAKLMGDGVLAYFGWPRAHEDEAERAVRAGLAVVETVARLRVPDDGALAARVGIATGLVVVGELVGRAEARERAVVGDTPNIAARLQQLAEPGTVVVAERTRRLLGEAFECADAGGAELKGFAEPVRAFRVLRPSQVAGRFESLRGATATPLVGREQEFALLLDWWAQAKIGEGQVVLLAGEPGVGKSRLVLALREHVRAENRPRLRYQCSPYHTSSALHPVIAQLERAAEIARGDDDDAKLEKLQRLLGDAAQALPPLADLLGIRASPDPTAAGMTPQERKTRTFNALLAHLEGMAGSGPVLFVLEDAHWIDPTTEELFELVVERAQALPVLLVVTFRLEFKPPWAGRSHITSLTLSRLGSAAIAEIAERVAGKPLPEPVVEEITTKTDGVPLFVEELTKAVVESGQLRDYPEGYVLEGALSPLDIPATLQDSLLARLDRLAPVKEVAQIGAAIGREFGHELLAAVASLPLRRLTAALDELMASELVYRRGLPPEATYVFKHALVQDAAYGTLLRGRRRDLHRRIAAAIEAQRPGLAGSEPEILAHHYTKAGLPERAAAFYLAAGQLAKAKHARYEATAHLEACLRLAAETSLCSEPLGAMQREAWLILGDLAGLAEDLERANACYDQALTLTEGEVERRAVSNRHHRLGFASREGARLAFYEHGSGEPAVVFVNPIVYGLAIFQPILERLCDDFRVITVDCRGAGRSDPLVRPYGIISHAEDLRAIIEAAGAAPIVGVGISRGSNQLLHLTSRHPELVSKLMIVGTPIVHHGPVGNTFFDADYLRRRAEAYAQEDVDALLRLQAEFVYTEEYAAELRRMAMTRGSTLSRDTILSFYDVDPDMDVEPLLGSIRLPTLVAHGREDRLNSFAAAEYIVARLPQAQLYAFEGKGHNPMFTATEEFCDVLRRFVRTGDAACAPTRATPGEATERRR